MQLRLPNASSALRRLSAINPEITESENSRAYILRLPPQILLGGCPFYELESEIRNLESLSSTLDHTTCLNFWHGAAAYESPSWRMPFASPRRRCSEDLATSQYEGGFRARVLSQVSLTKTELRNKIKLDVLAAIPGLKLRLRLQHLAYTPSSFFSK